MKPEPNQFDRDDYTDDEVRAFIWRIVAVCVVAALLLIAAGLGLLLAGGA